MCSGDFSPALEAIGEFIGRGGTGCVTRDVMPCDGAEDTSCPPFPYSGVPGVCQPISSIDPDTGMSLPPKFYCSSGIQVRTKISNNVPDVAGALQGSGYCLEGSIATPAFPRGCVIDPVHYQWQDCPGGLQGIKLRWNNEVDALNRLSAMEIQVRYNSAED
jgi:hypothetical protein